MPTEKVFDSTQKVWVDRATTLPYEVTSQICKDGPAVYHGGYTLDELKSNFGRYLISDDEVIPYLEFSDEKDTPAVRHPEIFTGWDSFHNALNPKTWNIVCHLMFRSRGWTTLKTLPTEFVFKDPSEMATAKFDTCRRYKRVASYLPNKDYPWRGLLFSDSPTVRTKHSGSSVMGFQDTLVTLDLEEVWHDCGDDGHTEYRFMGYRLIPTDYESCGVKTKELDSPKNKNCFWNSPSMEGAVRQFYSNAYGDYGRDPVNGDAACTGVLKSFKQNLSEFQKAVDWFEESLCALYCSSVPFSGTEAFKFCLDQLKEEYSERDRENVIIYTEDGVDHICVNENLGK